ncbi:MAG TPA: GtrA family protein [Candidatus Coprosoma intestinipullorum]|uniref:GtrA family protein n=1 Tax=Candidatus Coprosoma intestinipullorum TaxID=2840752 RepID=A0A9D0ZP94_9FIRM|nr:GtrA family protein [Candidatus Coprosoma intestinipullorum]
MKKYYELALKYYKKYDEIINYLIFGVLTTVVTIITYAIFTNTFLSSKSALDIQIANVLSWIIAVTFAYLTNRKYVFKSKAQGSKRIKEIINFFLARISSLIVEMLFMYVTVTVLSYNDFICKIIAQAIVIIFNYVCSKLIIFKKEENH